MYEAFVDDGFEAELAAGGAEALRKLVYRHPDVILLDLRMPGWSGLDTLREMQEENGWRGPKRHHYDRLWRNEPYRRGQENGRRVVHNETVRFGRIKMHGKDHLAESILCPVVGV